MTDVGGWDFAGEPAVTGSGMVTLVEGSSFCVCQSNGDITDGGGTQGLFFRDSRLLSSWRLTVDGKTPEPLVVMEPQSFEARFISRTAPARDASESAVLVERHRLVGVGMREDIVVRNLSPVPEQMTLELSFDADFADLFAVKESRVQRKHASPRKMTTGGVVLRDPNAAAGGVAVRGQDWTEDGAAEGLRITIEVAPRSTWTTSVAVCPIVDGEEMTPLFGSGTPTADSSGKARLARWTQSVPTVDATHAGMATALRASIRDLGALRIFDPADPEHPAVAAGAPWFMALFGRDSLIASYLTLLFDQDLALGTLRMLARHQGVEVDDFSEEQPGRILHEIRFGADLPLALGSGGAYYGTADATPLFVVLLGELSRWGLEVEHLETLLPHADRALDWIRHYGDRDGDGFVEYQRSTGRGLENQGWKDSWDGVNFADGRLAEAPVALAEVQGYVYAAYLARAEVAKRLSDPATAADCLAAAEQLKAQFNDAFWLPDSGYYATALDRNKQPVDALASNMGHCLWSGIVADEHAGAVVTRLMSDEMFTGWGIRTLATGMGRYNPMSYHNGSVWPHDNALIVGGFRRYGFIDEAQRLSVAMIEASETSAGRLPELFCGFARADFPQPVPYPTSCSPQAWAAATPVHLLRVMLGVQPDLPAGRLEIVPHLAPQLGEVRLGNLPLGDARLRLRARAGDAEVSGVPFGLAATSEGATMTFRVAAAANSERRRT